MWLEKGDIIRGKFTNDRFVEGKRYELQADGTRTLFQAKYDQEGKEIERKENEEKEILRVAINMGVDIDTARMALAQVCENANYLLESVLLKNLIYLRIPFIKNIKDSLIFSNKRIV